MQDINNNDVQELNVAEVEAVSGASWAGAAAGGMAGVEFGLPGMIIGAALGALLL